MIDRTPPNALIPVELLKNARHLNDAEFRQLFEAIPAYMETRNLPNLTGGPAALWEYLRPALDDGIATYNRRCEANKGNRRGRSTKDDHSSPVVTNGDHSSPVVGKYKTSSGSKETSFGSKENAPPEGVAAPPQGDFFQNELEPGPNFMKWSTEQFRRSVEDEVVKHPEFAPIEAAFCDYWLESDPKGRPHFKLEKTWSTAGRLRSWLRREGIGGGFRPGPPIPAPPEPFVEPDFAKHGRPMI